MGQPNVGAVIMAIVCILGLQLTKLVWKILNCSV